MTDDIDGIVERAIEAAENRYQLWIRLVSELRCSSVCEIGVWKGEFAQTLLENVPGIETYTLVDPWKNLPNWNKPANKTDIEFEEIRHEALERVSKFRGKIVEIRETTKKASALLGDRSIDFAYVDGDHTLRGITMDLLSILPKIREGGYIGGDDFTKTIWQHGRNYSPTEVFPFAVYFAEAFDLKIYTLPLEQFLIVNDASGFTVRDNGRYAHLTPAQIYARPPAHASGLIGKALRRLPGNLGGRLRATLLRGG